jgi:hypothetical protein
MEKWRILYTQPTIGASTKLHPEKSLAASWFVRAYDQFIKSPQLTRRGWRSAINRILNDRDVDSTTSMTYALRCTARLTGDGRKNIYRDGLSLFHAPFNGAGPRRGIREEAPLEGFYSRAIMVGARKARVSLVWWSQRDLNPCLSLERTDETEEKQSDDDSESSDE